MKWERGALWSRDEMGGNWGGDIPSPSDSWIWKSVLRSPSGMDPRRSRKQFYCNLISADRLCWLQMTANSSPFHEYWVVRYLQTKKVGVPGTGFWPYFENKNDLSWMAEPGKCQWTTMDRTDCLWRSSRSSKLQRRLAGHYVDLVASNRATGNSRLESEKFPPFNEKFPKIPVV